LRAKFKKLYSADNYEDPRLFHLVIDTTTTEVEETVQKAYEEFKE
jgi:cytidylate kinase